MDTLCYCGSAMPFRDCCGPLLSGKHRAATAVALMRSRYTAYCQHDPTYLLKTWHPDRHPAALDFSGDATEWIGLTIVRQEAGGPNDKQGTVEFVAAYRQDGQLRQLHESSRFVRETDEWLYWDGILFTEPKLGRNDPCPCGSGKKYKKCCG